MISPRLSRKGDPGLNFKLSWQHGGQVGCANQYAKHASGAKLPRQTDMSFTLGQKRFMCPGSCGQLFELLMNVIGNLDSR